MSVGQIESELQLKRWLSKQLATPGMLPPPKPDVSLVKAGVPSDEDFPQDPKDGTTAYDRESGTLYIRDQNEWKPV